ncbi:MAG: YgcG family protein, partial [Thermoanaerobaculia bacterium]|nr:YgcG family protein [Thermoanaerobaculia bacterium]
AILAVIDGGAEALPAQGEFLWSGKKSPKEILAAVGISLFVLLILGVFSTMALVTPGGGGWFLYFFMIPFNSLFPFALFGGKIAGAIALGWIFGAPILRLILPKTKAGKRWQSSVGPIQWSGGRSSGGGYSGGGGGGYSGGGGSFGGGGASSSW